MGTHLSQLRTPRAARELGCPSPLLTVNPVLWAGDIQVEEIKKMKIGDPLDRSTDHGPQNHQAHLEKLLQYCEAGVKEGATLVYGGRQVQRPGKTPAGDGHLALY